MRAQEFVNEVTIDNRTGAGSVPWNQEVDYRGLRVAMKPSTFLRLALPLTDQDNSRMERHIGTGGTIGAPFLDIVVPEAWQSGDFSEPAQVKGHDGRHRMQAISKLEGDAPVETHLFPKYLRNRDLTPEIVQRLQAGMVTQSGRYMPGPLFDVDFKSVSRPDTELAEGLEKFNYEVLRPGFRWSEEINGITYLVRTQWDNMPEVIARINNREVGRVTFIKHDTRTALESVSTYVSPKWQGHGIAKNMYAVMRMLGANIWPSGAQTAMGKNMWAKWKKHSDVKHLTSMNAKIDQPGVAEAFDQPYSIKWEKSEHGDYDALATLDDGSYLHVMFEHTTPYEVNVSFWRNNSLETTGNGDSQRVFATVLTAIKQFLKTEQPANIAFSASKDVEPGQNSMSRSKLYSRLVQRYATAWGYKSNAFDHGDEIVYELSRIKPIVKTVGENFADGKGPGRPGDSQRHGIPKKATMAELEKASHAKGRKGQLARWQLNMRRGRKK
jgi:hypothetical protein